MANLYFENSYGGCRVIADCNTSSEVWKAIHTFIDTCNKNKPKNKRFKINYVRENIDNGQTWYDVGSHTEFFIWDGVDNDLSRSRFI